MSEFSESYHLRSPSRRDASSLLAANEGLLLRWASGKPLPAGVLSIR